MPDKAYVKTGFSVDQQSVSQAQQANVAVEKSMAQVAQAANQVTEATQKAGRTLSDVFAKSKAAVQDNIKAVDELRAKYTTSAEERKKQIAEIETAMIRSSGTEKDLLKKHIEANLVRAAEAERAQLGGNGTEAIGRGSTAFGAIGSVASAFGGSGGAEISRAAGDILGAVESITKFGDVAKDLPGVFGEIAQAGASLAAPFGAIAASFGAVLAIAAPVAIAVGTVAIVLNTLKSDAEAATKAEQERFEAETRRIQQEDAARRESRAKSMEEAKRQLADDAKLQQDYLDQLTRKSDERDKVNKQLEELANNLGNLAKRNILSAQSEQLGKDIDAINANLKDVNSRISANINVSQPLIAQYDQQRAAVKALTQATEIQLKTRQLEASAIQQLEQLTDGRVAKTKEEQEQLERSIKNASKATEIEIDTNRRRIQENNRLIAELEKLGPKNEYAAETIKKLREENEVYAATNQKLLTTTLPAIKAKEDEAVASSRVAFAIGTATKAAQDFEQKGVPAILKGLQKLGDDIQKKTAEDLRRAIDIAEDARLAGTRASRSGGYGATRDTIQANQEAIESNHRRIEALREEAKTNQYAADEIKKLEQENKRLVATNRELEKVLPQILQREKDIAEFDFNKGVAEITRKGEQDREDAERKHQQQLSDITLKFYQERAEIERKYADQLIDIARKAADEAAQQAVELERKQADLALGVQRSLDDDARAAQAQQLDVQIKFYRDQEKAFRDHQRNLEQIREDAQEREFALILNRDFSGLFFSRRQTTRDINRANRAFNDQQSDATTAYSQQQSDLKKSLDQQRQQKLIDYQRQLQDAQTAYQRQRQDANTQRQIAIRDARIGYQRELEAQQNKQKQELAALQTAYKRELDELALKLKREYEMRRRAYEDELKLIEAGSKAALAAQQAAQKAVANTVATVAGGIANIVSSLFKKRATGGGVDAGQFVTVNEPESSGRESVRMAGRDYQFPGPGLFMPFEPGYVNANSSNRTEPITFQPVFNISGGRDPQAIANALRPMVREEAMGVLKRVTGVA